MRHYDAIGLLKPAEISPSGYWQYSDENLETLQQILFFKELGFPLQKIKEIIDSPSFNRLEALQLQRNMLIEKRNRLNKMINLIEKKSNRRKGKSKCPMKKNLKGSVLKEIRMSRKHVKSGEIRR
ncbi:hypothetical protein BpJC7_01390 [Weizmannia acidilactici]|uniref:HTH merR-type domain-containing protein n=1 Tax=Weizmannia acidilactici TaxID=2607726 RepID=A0A5J4J1M9_9BACI|nr:hypothetical protein BpJC4_10320 [Weizmannia acidilactici]GER68836.1 hypothetical protein BpJC7_01390 [Weizmannia acidilactici]GER74581.1 hypothetical protein BpPP18_26480 [Weizmannia acidilactici]